jgi:hypothetical protein
VSKAFANVLNAAREEEMVEALRSAQSQFLPGSVRLNMELALCRVGKGLGASPYVGIGSSSLWPSQR